MHRIKVCMALSFTLLLVACDIGDERGDSGSDGNPTLPFATLEPDAAFPVPFAYLSGVREMSDGRLLAADPLGQVLLRLDLEAGTADTLGGQGKGPQEYEGPDHVLPLQEDSTLLVDLGNARLTVVSPEGGFVGWIPMVRTRESGRPRTLFIRFTDGAGDFYLSAPYDREGTPPDSAGISRIDRETDAETVVAWAWRPERPSFRSGAKQPILLPMDDWAVGPDGSIALVRANGFSVDWVRPGGETVTGGVYAVETYLVEEEDKARELEEMGRAAVFTAVVVGDSGEESRQMGRGFPPGGGPGVEDFDWPEILPIFRPNGTWVSPRGEAWVQRIMPSGGAARYEIFDRAGFRLGFVELPAGGRVVGFGTRPESEGMVYLARVDDLGLVWLERHRLRRR